MLSSSVSLALSGYSDWFIVFFALSIFITLASLSFSRLSILTKNAFVVVGSFIFGAIATGPYIVRFLLYLPRRLQDAGVGGWPMPVWTSPAENIGIFNPYNAYEGRPGSSELIVLLANAFTIAVILRLLIAGNHKFPKIIFGAITFLLLLIGLKTNYLDHVSNYQYFKAVGVLSPYLLPLLGLIVGAHKTGKINRLLVASLCLSSVIASANYILHYRNTSIRLPNTIGSQVLKSNVQDKFDSYDILTTSEFAHPTAPPYNAWIFTPFMDGRLINRNTTELLIDTHKPHKLAVIINEVDCKDWTCVNLVNPAHIGELTPQYKILLFDQPSQVLIKPGPIDYNEISKIISKLSSQINGPTFDSDLLPN
jgi:hypothetical protein